MAARILGAVVPNASYGRETKFEYSSGSPAPPWVQGASVHFKSYFDQSAGLCRADELDATFEPVDAFAAQKKAHESPGYDPPTVLTSTEWKHFFAEPGKLDAHGKPECGPVLDYFIASDSHEANQAFYAFARFRETMAKENPGIPISCVKEGPGVSCDNLTDVLRKTTSLIAVEYITHHRETGTEILELNVDGPSGAYLYKLGLTLSNMNLTGVELRLIKSPRTRPGH